MLTWKILKLVCFHSMRCVYVCVNKFFRTNKIVLSENPPSSLKYMWNIWKGRIFATSTMIREKADCISKHLRWKRACLFSSLFTPSFRLHCDFSFDAIENEDIFWGWGKNCLKIKRDWNRLKSLESSLNRSVSFSLNIIKRRDNFSS